MKIQKTDKLCLYGGSATFNDLVKQLEITYNDILSDKNINPADITHVEITYERDYNDSVNVVLEVTSSREETAIERHLRLNKQAEREAWEREQYETLKKKFEGK